jgi:tetrahydromethanopterin S-methyltransferase subunit G
VGLFKKKPMPMPLPEAAPSGDPPAPAGPISGPVPVVTTTGPVPVVSARKVKGGVDPVDFLQLRAEMLDLKARLEAAEQAKSVVEARLAALDATTTALSTERMTVEPAAATVVVAEADPEVLARLDSLSARVDEVAAAHEAAQEAALHAPPPPSAPAFDSPAAPAALDPDVLARLDELAQRVDGVDHTVTHSSEQFAGQLAQLNARVVAQAELGAQLSSLRDRLDDLNRAQPASDAPTSTVDDAVGQLAERLAANDEALRRTAEQVNHIEQRLDTVSTELANQLSELGRDIDGLAALANEGDTDEDDNVEQLVEQLVDQLRTGQVKLANEQARYEIAFRQDLAALAEQVRRGH